jgi:hypothetical protein
MPPSSRRIAQAIPLFLVLAAVSAITGACFDFDATTAGGPLTDASTGGADANPTPHVDGGSYCASLPSSAGVKFCDDFDEGPNAESWNAKNATGGSAAETDASFESPPNSLDVTINDLPPGAALDVSRREELPGIPKLPATLVFGFSVEPIAIDPSAGAAIVLGALDFLDDAQHQNRYSLELSINVQNMAAALVLAEQTGYDGGATGPYTPYPIDPNVLALGLNTWTDLVVQIAWMSPNQATATLSVGKNRVPILGPVTLTMTVQATHLQIGIGTSYVTEPSQGWEIRYDNVFYEVQ